MRNNGHQNRRQNGRHPNHNNNSNGHQNRNGKGQNSLNRSYESNGPGVKVRGSAQNVAEKYIQLARDAQASGDHVAFENFMQHAEHYLRLINAVNEAMRLANPNWRPEPVPSQEDEEGDEEQMPSPHGSRRVYEISDEQPSEGEQPQFVPRSQREFVPRENTQRENQSRENQQRDNAPREHQPRERFQRPRFEPTAAPAEEGLEPRAPEGEARPRFNRFERNRHRNRPFAGQEGEQPVISDERPALSREKPAAAPENKPAPVIENLGLPAFITAPKPIMSEEAPVAAPRRRGRPPRDTSQDIVIAEG